MGKELFVGKTFPGMPATGTGGFWQKTNTPFCTMRIMPAAGAGGARKTIVGFPGVADH